MREAGVRHLALQAVRLGFAGGGAYIVYRILDAGAMRAFFGGRHVRRWAYAHSDPFEFWVGVAILAAASAACLWSFVKHLDGRGWRR